MGSCWLYTMKYFSIYASLVVWLIVSPNICYGKRLGSEVSVEFGNGLIKVNVSASYSRFSDANGLHIIQVANLKPFPVYCNGHMASPGWIVIARRTSSQLNFQLSWEEYKQGFGHLLADFFIGLEKLHAITNSQSNELYIQLEDFNGETRYAQYDEFSIGSEDEFYALTKLGQYSGSAGDSLSSQRGMKFSTYDKENDLDENRICAVQFVGPWWHRNCMPSHLFGLYLNGEYSRDMYAQGIHWTAWRGQQYSYKSMQMMVRPKSGK